MQYKYIHILHMIFSTWKANFQGIVNMIHTKVLYKQQEDRIGIFREISWVRQL